MIIISERKEGVETHRCVWRVGGNGSGGRAVSLLYTPPSSPSCTPPVEQTQSIQSARCVHGTISRLNHKHRPTHRLTRTNKWISRTQNPVPSTQGYGGRAGFRGPSGPGFEYTFISNRKV